MSKIPSEMNQSRDGGFEEENTDDELYHVNINLKAIENVMIAENRRRIESNQIMNQFIDDFLGTLQDNIKV